MHLLLHLVLPLNDDDGGGDVTFRLASYILVSYSLKDRSRFVNYSNQFVKRLFKNIIDIKRKILKIETKKQSIPII
jgi:hypothetical protein